MVSMDVATLDVDTTASVREILLRKGTEVETISASATVMEAIQRMNDEKIGALVVVEDGDTEHIAGIFTERDVLSRVVAKERPPREMQVRDAMTREVLCCTPDSPLGEASRLIKDHRVRHLPVCDGDGRLCGMISIGDLNAYYASDQEATVRFLHEYICGRA